MKRALLLVLILANVGFLAWHRWYSVPPGATEQPAPPLTGQPLQLVSELSAAQRQALAAAPSLPEPLPAAGTAAAPVGATAAGTTSAAVAALVCASYGPFPSDAAVQQGAARLKPLGIEATSHLVAGKAKLGYWVYLPPFASKREADGAAALLKRRGVKDIYVVTDEANRNAISLGVFSQRTYAEDRLKQMRRMGYRAILAERFRDEPHYWLDARGTPGVLPQATVFSDLAEEDAPIGKATGVCPG